MVDQPLPPWEEIVDPSLNVSMWQHPAPSNSAGRPNTSQLSMDSMYMRNLVQTSPGCSSTSVVAKQQDPFNLLQHTAQSTLHNIMEPQCTANLPDQAAHSRLQLPAFLQPQSLTLPDKILPGNQTQPILLHGNLESSPQAELTSSIDWINEAFQNIHNMKEMYLPDLRAIHSRALEMRKRANTNETVHRAEKSRLSAERMINFLNISGSDLLHLGREKFYHFMNNVISSMQNYRTSNSAHTKQTPPVEPPSFTHSEGASHQYHQPHPIQSLRQGGALNLPQTSFNSFKIGSSVGLHKMDSTSIVNNASQYNNTMRQWGPPGNSLRMLLHSPNGISQHNTSHQPLVSSRIFNSLDYSIPISMPPLLNNQQDAGMKRQKMKQQMMSDKNKQQMMQKWSGQRWSSVLPPSSSPYTNFPQNSKQSSPLFELKDLSTKFLKSASPSLSALSPNIPSPLTPSSNPADSAGSPLIEESGGRIAKSTGTSPQLLLPDKIPTLGVSTDSQRLTKSCLHRESTGNKQSKHYKGDASKRLVEVVKKISSSALTATLRDINAVAILTDRIAGHFLNGDPIKNIFLDLADEIKGGIPSIEHETGLTSRMKRELESVVLNDSITDMESYTSGRMKRLKKEPNNLLLLKEINEINKKLIEVVVEVMAVEQVFREGSGGTIIRFSYIPIGLSSNIKTSSTSKLMFPNLLLDLIVYADYPNSSPTVLDKMPSCFRDEEGKYLWMKAKTSFSLSIRAFTEPMSVKEMAEMWDICAREVFHDFAEQIEEGNFSSIYGKWETCAVAG